MTMNFSFAPITLPSVCCPNAVMWTVKRPICPWKQKEASWSAEFAPSVSFLLICPAAPRPWTPHAHTPACRGDGGAPAHRARGAAVRPTLQPTHARGAASRRRTSGRRASACCQPQQPPSPWPSCLWPPHPCLSRTRRPPCLSVLFWHGFKGDSQKHEMKWTAVSLEERN